MARSAFRVLAALAVVVFSQLASVQPAEAQSSSPPWTVVPTAQGPMLVAFRWPGDDSRSRTRFTSQPRNRLRPPQAPSGVIAIDNGNRGAQISWVDNSTTATGFQIERSPALLSQVTVSASVTQYDDDCGPGQFLYRVRAFNEAGASKYSSWATVVVNEIPPAAPSAMAASNNGDGSASLAWSDNSNNEVRFEIQRSPAFTVGVSVGSNITDYRDEPGPGTFAYRVRAVNAIGASEFTAWTWVNITTAVPAAPTNLAATANLNGSATLTWSDNSGNETGFQVQRNPAFPTGLLLLSANATSYIDVSGPGAFQYRVRAVNAAGGSDFTQWVSVSVLDPIPVAPSNVQAVDAGNRRAMVTWNDNSSNETGFEIQRNPAFQGVVTVGANVTGYIDQCGPGQWQYRVRALGVVGNSAFSSWASVTVAEVPPAAPSNVVLADLGNQSQVRVTWVDNSNNETGFKIQRETQSGTSWGQTQNFTTGTNVTQYTDAPGLGTHRYRVAATNSVGDSPWTAWSTITLAGGWTQFTPSTDTRIVYVSSSTGNDNNTGLSEAAPVKSLARAYTLLRSGYPDWMLLKRGDTWVVSPGMDGIGVPNGNSYMFQKSGGRSASEPMLISSYGVGSRPIVKSSRVIAFWPFGGGQLKHFALVGIEFYAYKRNPNDPAYSSSEIAYAGADVGECDNLLIEDCRFSYYSTGMNIRPTGPTNILKDIRIRRCVISDNYDPNAHSQGLFIKDVQNLLLEENAFVRNGWYPGLAIATVFNRNLYIKNCPNTTMRGNIDADGASGGAQMRQGGICEANLFVRTPEGVGFGHPENAPGTLTTGIIRQNVVLGGRNIESSGRAFGIGMGTRLDGVEVYENIIAHNQLGTANVDAIYFNRDETQSSRNITIRNNIVYNWDYNGAGAAQTFRDNPVLQNVVIRDNIFAQPGQGRIVRSSNAIAGVQYLNNRYTSARDPASWFIMAGSNLNFAQWQSTVPDTGSSTVAPSFPSPQRTIESYMGSLGMATTVDAFLDEVRLQSKDSWRSAFTARTVINHIREGFALPPLGP